MRRGLTTRDSFTLTELLIAGVLVSIAVGGMISVDMALRRAEQASMAQKQHVGQLSAALLTMKRDAADAFGIDFAVVTGGADVKTTFNPTVGDTGVFLKTGTEDIDTFDDPCVCMRLHDGATINDFFPATIACYYEDGGSLYRKTYAVANEATKVGSTPEVLVTNLTELTIERIPAGTEPIQALRVTLTRTRTGSPVVDPIRNPVFSLSTELVFDAVAR